MLNAFIDWYGGRVPPFGTQAFINYLSESVGLVEMFAGRKVEVITSYSSIGAAYVRERSGAEYIMLPVWVVSREKLKAYLDIDLSDGSTEYEVVALLNTMIMHEAFHAKYPGSEGTKKSEVAELMYNLVEDLYIEHKMHQQPYGIFSRFGLTLLFSDDYVEKKATDNDLANMLYAWRREDVRSNPYYNDHPYAIDLLMAVKDTDDPDKRVELADKLTEYIEKNGEHKLTHRPNQNGKIDENAAGRDADPSSRNSSESARAMDNLATAVQNQQLTRSKGLSEAHRLHEATPNGTRRHIPTDEAFESFGRILAQLRVVKVKPVTPNRTGSKLNVHNLRRAYTDQKIFKAYDEAKETDAEVVIVVDASKSMDYHKLRFPTLTAARGAFESLKRARIPTAVYSFTTREFRKVASYQLQGNEDNFNNEANAYSHNTPMAEAIKQATEKFSGKPTKKIMFVLADGEPNTGVTGIEPEQLCRLEIEHARQCGITVYALALIEKVYGNLADIFGDDYTLNAWTNVSESLRDAIQKQLL